ncbi:MAG: chemotaxis histidine kinase [Candidatus Scalindua rubra]|uniref:Chemotaxis protein CheA n=1 Tax=Candidatus Scalindua rubra TaxID=1872076 RepID=A0A1E3XF34_9BACT|nr:MAG: chemotaxis histidine kinase [Candidatus Scalindua rubra]
MSEHNTEVKDNNPESDNFNMNIKEDSEIFLEFLSETHDHLEDAESNILNIEEDTCDYEIINAIFRGIHSIKGSAGFLGLTDIQRLSHELETLLDKVRKDEIAITQEIINISLNSIDALRKLRENLATKVDKELGKIEDSDSSPKEQPVDIQPLIDRILSILRIADCGRKVPMGQRPFSGLREKTIRNPWPRPQSGSHQGGPKSLAQTARSAPGQAEINNSRQTEEIKKKSETSEEDYIGEILLNEGTITQEQLDKALKDKNKKIGETLVDDGSTTPDKVEKALKEQKPIGQILTEKGEITKHHLEDALKQQGRKIGEILVENRATIPDKIDVALQTQQTQRQSRLQSRTVKVDTAKLDNLFDLVGELVIANTLVCGEMQSVNNNGTSKNLSQLSKITKDIQDQVMSMRMVSLKQTFQKMSRLVRDVSLHAGKKIKLTISGEDTELDKNVIEEIADPLVHILRNSIDHGIEPENERIAKGKPKEGTIRLSAFHRGGNIIIEIEDDGKGLQKDMIVKKAIEKGLINDQSELNDNQIYNLIFAPGFSTADKVTNISGRGVGTDVVKKNIEKLRGKVEVTSEEGNGTVFTIKLPLTLAIIDGIVVNVGDTRYIIPTTSIEESIRPKKEEISTIKNQGEVINMRGNLFPLVRLHKLYNIDTTKTNPWEAIVVIVESEGGRFSILVDELLGQQQVVIKSLGDRFKDVKGISGGAILGDGKVGLILDTSGIRDAALAA